MKFDDKIKEHAARTRVAKAMGGEDKLARRRRPEILNARERIDYLLDPGSFRESGLFGVSYIPEMRGSTPGDGKITGFGKLDGRRVGAGIADEIAAWWTTEVSFMNPRTAVMVVHGIKEEDDPERFQKLLAAMSRQGSAYDLGAVFGAKEVLDPRETREYLKETLEIQSLRLTNGVGRHLVANWPTSY